jgi:hypothetical protein
MLGLLSEQANFLIKKGRNLLTTTAKDPNGHFRILNAKTGDIFHKMASFSKKENCARSTYLNLSSFAAPPL